jgi:LPS-assembly lipoprotein
LLFKTSFQIFLCIILTACGFYPLYSTKGSANIIADFSSIYISPSRDRIGQMLSNELKHLLNPLREPIKPKYRLTTMLSKSINSLAIKKTALATRSNLTVTSQHTLIDSGSSIILSTGVNKITVSYNIFSSDYATLSAEKDAKERAIKELAQDIRLQIGAYFKAQNQLNVLP